MGLFDNKKENEMDVVISTEGKGVEELELVCKEITNNSFDALN